jgi:hypothetical protein
MAKGKKREGEKKKPPKSPGKPGAKDGSKDKKHCHAFDFGKGTCRFGAKCRYLQERGKGDAKVEPLVTTLLSSAMKRAAAAIAKKNKQKEKKPKLKEKKAESEDDEDFSSMLASCFLAPVRNTIKRD